MDKFKNFMFGLTSLIGGIGIFGGGVLFAFMFVLLFISCVVLEAITNYNKSHITKIWSNPPLI